MLSSLEEEELETKPQTGSIGGESSDEDRWEMPAEGDGEGRCKGDGKGHMDGPLQSYQTGLTAAGFLTLTW